VGLVDAAAGIGAAHLSGRLHGWKVTKVTCSTGIFHAVPWFVVPVEKLRPALFISWFAPEGYTLEGDKGYTLRSGSYAGRSGAISDFRVKWLAVGSVRVREQHNAPFQPEHRAERKSSKFVIPCNHNALLLEVGGVWRFEYRNPWNIKRSKSQAKSTAPGCQHGQFGMPDLRPSCRCLVQSTSHFVLSGM
jgi:hypothetical protein